MQCNAIHIGDVDVLGNAGMEPQKYEDHRGIHSFTVSVLIGIER